MLFLFHFQLITIIKLGTHLVPQSYKRATWLVIFVSYLHLTSKINIIISSIL